MKKKSFVCIALTAVMALSTAMLAACGDEETPPEETGEPVYALGTPDSLYNSKGSLTEEGAGMNSTHDPVVVEAKNGKKSEYYAFSTDNNGQYGVQIRKSDDLYTWERVGAAIKGYDNYMSPDAVKSMYESGNAELNEVFNVVSGYSGFNCWTLWAPDVVPAKSNKNKDVNGAWWLYSCWTSSFGSERSVIFKLTSQNGITGPYTYDGIIVQDSNNDYNINEIDPSVYYSADGSRMFMSYGSYSGGFATIELNPETGLRKSGETTEPGKRILSGSGFDAEGSVINYHSVNVYTGDIATEDYDETKWEKQGKYYMMGSWGALAYNYNMRVWTSDTPDGEFTSERGMSGLQISATWTWRKEGEGNNNGSTDRKDKETNFYIPGHNDMLTTSNGVNIIAYHTRVAEGSKDNKPSYAEGEHFLYTSMYDFNAKGQLVINPNRYVGEKIGTVTAEDLLSTMGGTKEAGLYSAIVMQSANVSYTTKSPIAHPVDLTLNADGTLKMGDETGAWKVYGDHYIWIKIGDLNYYGSIMPAQIRQYEKDFGYDYNNGLTISAISDMVGNENKILYMNMQFDI